MSIKATIYCTIILGLVGCTFLEKVPSIKSLPFVHKIEVQQGNVITQDMVSQLKRGMDKKKIKFIMGNPIIKDTFNSDRWDYLYTFHIGEGQVKKRVVTLVFEKDLLDKIEGDVRTTNKNLVPNLHNDTSVRVPPVPVRTFMDNIRAKVPFIKEDEKMEVVETFLENDTQSTQEEETIKIDFEEVVEEDPYDNIQRAPGSGPVNATEKKDDEKGFFSRLFEEQDPERTSAGE